LPAAGEIRAGNKLHQLAVRELGVADQCHSGFCDLAQIVRGDFSRHADRDARCAIEQHKGQAPRQQLRLFGRAVVVGLKIDRAQIDFIQQQFRDRR